MVSSTMISEVYHALKAAPKKLRDEKLDTAGRQMVMDGFMVVVRLKVGNRWYSENVHIGPTEQEMLLGFDILFHRESLC